jgi:predicted ATPase/class 3 adenylate cyclase
VRELPTGTVTFFFSDIEGSTKLLDELGPDEYADALSEHRRRMREAFAAHGGVEVDTQGDAFFAAFSEASGAVAAAEQAQCALAQGPIRVRIGIHSGEPLVTAEGYVGIDVHRGARVMSAGHGGQVLVSQATYALLENAGALTELGRHRLKDLTEPQPLYQLGDGDFPPLKTLYQTNLPVQTTPLVGREAELAEVLELLGQTRLLTLTGAGGSGKTRLALQAAAELVDDYRDGVWWVSLAALRDPTLVEPTIAQTVGAKNGLAEHLRTKQTLLLLDNFEQLVEEAFALAALLAEAPDVRILVTSRERLGLSAEQEYPVPTLVPVEAVELFASRARQLKPAFAPDEHVEEICRRLDGLPLALELAAARIEVLSPAQIVDRLGRSLELLTAGPRDAPERHRTLRATIEWSYDLLTAEEKELFAQVAVFAGGFTFEAAEAVCKATLDSLQSLSKQNLVRSIDGRSWMLETIREYATWRLDASGEAETVRRRHAEHYAAEGVKFAWRARNSEPDALERLDAELDNMRAALTWSFENGEIDTAQRLLEGVWWIWLTKGFAPEGDRWAQAVFDQTSGVSEQRGMTAALAGEFARFRGDYDRAIALKERAIELYEAAEADPDLVASGLADLAETLIVVGDLENGRAVAERGCAMRRGLGLDHHMPHSERALVLIALRTGEFERAEELAERAVSTYAAEKQWSDLADALVLLASARRRGGDLVLPSTHIRQALEVVTRIRDDFVAVEALEEAAALLVARGEIDVAARLFAAAEQSRGASGVVSTDPSERDRLLKELAYRLSEAPTLELQQAVRLALDSLD